MPKLPKVTSLLFLCSILRKNWVRKLIFCIFLILWFWFWFWHFQSSQNAKFTMSLQYLKKEVRDEVDFLHTDKHQSFLKVDFKTLGIKVIYKIYYHYWWTWSSILKLLEVTSFQYLYSISKMKLGMEFIFCMQINIEISTRWHYSFWLNLPDRLKVPKKCFNYLCVPMWCKTFRYFAGVQSCSLLLVFCVNYVHEKCLSTIKKYFKLTKLTKITYKFLGKRLAKFKIVEKENMRPKE